MLQEVTTEASQVIENKEAFEQAQNKRVSIILFKNSSFIYSFAHIILQIIENY